MNSSRSIPAFAMVFTASLATSCESPPAGPGEDSVTTVFMTEEEALHTVFPDAVRRVSEDVTLTAEERGKVESILEARVLEPSFAVHAGIREDGSLDGFAVIHEEVGKFKPFQFIVGMERDGSVRRVAVLVYRESRGGEVAHRRFLSQYAGKRATDPIHVNRDILNVSGATMSVNALNLGVKKVLALVRTCYVDRPERIERLLRRPSASIEEGAAKGAAVEAPSTAMVEVCEARLVMGALCEIQAHGPDLEKLRRSVFRAFEEIEAADRALSDYRPESELSTISRLAGGPPVEVSRLTGEFLELAERMARESRGAFDVTVGPLVRAWGGREAVSRAPTHESLLGIRPLVGHQGLLVERSASGAFHARLARAGMVLDPGGLGKGYAVDLAVRRMREDSVTSALVNFSGNMYALGAPPGAHAWPIAVCDPAHPAQILGVVRLRDSAIASSGSYERSFVAGGLRSCHIVSPRTLEPVTGVLGTSVVAPSAALADGYSTAAFVLGRDGPALLEGKPGVEGMVVIVEGGSPRLLSTRGWRLEPGRPE